MARKSDIQYVSYYSSGSAARKIELLPPQPAAPAAPKPRPRPAKQQVVYVDPLALCSIAVAAVMLVLMAVGVFQLNQAYQQEQALSTYVSALEEENLRLQQEYDENLDLAQIEQAALALGMVPADQVEHLSVQVEVPETVQQELTWWESLQAFLASLFA